MNASRPRLASLMALVAVLVAGCARQSAPERRPLADVMASIQAEASEHVEASQALPDDPGDGAPEVAPSGNETSDAPARGANGAPDSAPTDQVSSAPEPASPATHDAVPEQHSDFPMTASLDKDCVLPGGSLTIFVEAGRNTGVGYHAVYAGGEGGAEPPYGHGHGGNGGDLTDDRGRYQDTWLVSPTAPIGPARVDVVAGRDGGFSTSVLHFDVADPSTGGCP